MDVAPGWEGDQPFALGFSPPLGMVAAGTGRDSCAQSLGAGPGRGCGSWWQQPAEQRRFSPAPLARSSGSRWVSGAGKGQGGVPELEFGGEHPAHAA